MLLLILVQVLADLIQVILLTLTRHSLAVVALRPVRRALPVREQARLILRLAQRLIQVL